MQSCCRRIVRDCQEVVEYQTTRIDAYEIEVVSAVDESQPFFFTPTAASPFDGQSVDMFTCKLLPASPEKAKGDVNRNGCSAQAYRTADSPLNDLKFDTSLLEPATQEYAFVPSRYRKEGITHPREFRRSGEHGYEDEYIYSLEELPADATAYSKKLRGADSPSNGLTSASTSCNPITDENELGAHAGRRAVNGAHGRAYKQASRAGLTEEAAVAGEGSKSRTKAPKRGHEKPLQDVVGGPATTNKGTPPFSQGNARSGRRSRLRAVSDETSTASHVATVGRVDQETAGVRIPIVVRERGTRTGAAGATAWSRFGQDSSTSQGSAESTTKQSKDPSCYYTPNHAFALSLPDTVDVPDYASLDPVPQIASHNVSYGGVQYTWRSNAEEYAKSQVNAT